MLLNNKKILVIGMARSGLAAANVLADKANKVIVCDIKSENEIDSEISKVLDNKVEMVFGKYPEVNKEKVDLIVISPGVPLNIPPVLAAYEEGVPVWGELELAYKMYSGMIIGITGTNGKTTTTSLIGQMFLDAEMPTIIAGNIGKPFIKEVKTYGKTSQTAVLEVSSFQLETIEKFKPHIAVFLNITPDHLDRHEDFQNYLKIKMKIFRNQSKDDWAILNYDDPVIRKASKDIKAKTFYFSQEDFPVPGIYIKDGNIIERWSDTENKICSLDNIRLRGKHNLENCLAAISSALLAGLDKTVICKTLENFSGAEHRLEVVAVKEGVVYINDSKGTNPEASLKAVAAYSDMPIILLAGGKDKGSEFELFAREIKNKVKNVILIGETALKIAQSLKKEGFKDYYIVESLEEAVKKAHKLSIPGDVILLSPACASWDMFSSYEERGNLFKSLVDSK